MKSAWEDLVEFKERQPLTENITADVVIIGAGLAGILTAYFFQKAGKSTILLERKRVCSGVSKNTTAKITSQHNLIYSRLNHELGHEKAALYARANENAIKQYAEIISQNSIACDFEEKDAYVYTLNDNLRVQNEAEQAKKLGIDAYYTDKCALPFKIVGAVGFRGQAQLNPLKLIKPLADSLTIFENCPVDEIHENTIRINGFSIKGRDVIITTHYPFINIPGYYFARMHQSRSYCIAVSGAQDVGGMYIADDSKYSFRNYNDLLLIGGSSHRTGENKLGGAYDSLKRAAANWYPNGAVEYTWSAQDCMPVDGIPYIGKYASSTPNMYVATGFQKWGMTSSMISAKIISDLILNGKSEYEELFTPQRFKASASIKQMAKDGAYAVAGLYKSNIQAPKAEFDEIETGHGGIIKYNDEKIGVYKSPGDEIYTINAKCPHLGCQLEWNSDELTWECPCHGSRFNYRGELLNSPATHDIN